MIRHWVPALSLAAAASSTVFCAAVVASGAGWNPTGIRWDFTNSGAFGDSFGPLNTLMAAVAAISAIAAFLSQRKELKRVEADSLIQRSLSDKRDFELTFFNLLTLFRETVKEIDVPDQYGANPVFGRDALKRILEDAIGGTLGSDSADRDQFIRAYNRFRDDLAHYFRLFYNILRFVDKSSVDDKMLYIRLLRATLSNAEIVLIALNCMFGGGAQKLTPLVEKYALLHNVSASEARLRRIVPFFDKSAFGDRNFSDAESDPARE